MNRNGELYPIHGLGPISKISNVNNGNRLVSLTSKSSKTRGIRQWATDNFGETSEFAKTELPRAIS
ncbi:hypothetical protein [Paenibacillus lignilyticus]|uniref:hypothetical protein n=1 Tax=Paenibacillus lignilyticus TaxID=1172615 RepID=UPI003B8348B7